ncbi:hypothetical protein RJ639_042672, partial [Escallonia herrerae]
KMAEGEEDDYMGDLSQFLPPEPSLPPKSSSQKVTNKEPQLLHPPSKKPKTQNWQDRLKHKREQKQHEEDQQTLANTKSAIPQSNIGFKMLTQMGYTPGSALGKGGSGLAEPVGLEIRRSRAGIGREDPREERMRREEERAWRERRVEEELAAEFGWRQKEQWRGKRVVVNFHKATAALAQLEKREVVEVEREEGEGSGHEEEEEEEDITAEVLFLCCFVFATYLYVVWKYMQDLQEILMKLRDEYQYCLFCGCQVFRSMLKLYYS